MNSMHARIARATALLATLLLGACAMFPVVSDGEDSALNLRGYDPVAYFTLGRPTAGSVQWRASHQGVTYRFASREHRDLFVADPARYAPQYGGWCAHGMAYAIKLGSDPLWWRIHQGRLFIYGDQEGHDFAGERLAFHIERGDHYWNTEARDSTPAWQYLKRVWFAKVPHYKRGCELEAEWLKKYPDRPHAMFKGRCER